jgi:hypothetical protein
MKRFTLVKSPSFVTSARKVSQRLRTCDNTFRFTLAKYLYANLGTHSFTQNKREIYECAVNGCNKKYFYLCNLKKHKKEHAE